MGFDFEVSAILDIASIGIVTPISRPSLFALRKFHFLPAASRMNRSFAPLRWNFGHSLCFPKFADMFFVSSRALCFNMGLDTAPSHAVSMILPLCVRTKVLGRVSTRFKAAEWNNLAVPKFAVKRANQRFASTILYSAGFGHLRLSGAGDTISVGSLSAVQGHL
jgi:hypothetical protein